MKLALLAIFLALPLHAQTRLTPAQTQGQALKATMTLVGITQDSLARLNPWLASSQSARVSLVSRMQNGSTPGTAVVQCRVADTLDSLAYARLDLSTVQRMPDLYPVGVTCHPIPRSKR